MKLSYRFLLVLSLFSIFSLIHVHAIDVLVKPNFFEERFEPADKLHAGCENSVDVVLYQIFETTKEVNLNIEYNTDEIEIIGLSSIQDEDLRDTYALEYGKIHFFKKDIKGNNLFKLRFKSNEGITGTNINILDSSYIISSSINKIGIGKNIYLAFAQVPECEPDITPPGIKLIQPKTIQERLPQDMFFIRDIRPLGINEKGVDKSSLVVNQDGKIYSGDSDYLKWSGSFLFFYPDDWLPVNDQVTIKITVKDKQVYGGPNKTEKLFIFETSSGLTFKDYMSPNKFRSLVYQTKEDLGLSSDCNIMVALYTRSDVGLKLKFKSIINRLGCTMPSPQEIKAQQESLLCTKEQIETSRVLQEIKSERQKDTLSSSAAIGWTLVVLIAMLHLYFVLCRYVLKICLIGNQSNPMNVLDNKIFKKPISKTTATQDSPSPYVGGERIFISKK